jgi:hypothetical protein
MDQLRSSYKIKDLSNRPLRLWMYNKSELVHDVTYLNHQTPMRTSCGRQYKANQMYSSEYFLQDYLQSLNELYPLSRHNLVWANDPLLADYYIIPHDYICICFDIYRPTLSDLEYRSLITRLSRDYFFIFTDKCSYSISLLEYDIRFESYYCIYSGQEYERS